MRITDIVFIDNRTQPAPTNFNRRWIGWITNIIWEYLGTKTDRIHIKPVDTGDINKPGILGNDLGHCRHVFQRAPAGGNIHYHGAI